MLLSTAEDLAKFVAELKRETDRGLPLVGAALIDDRLTETLRSFFCESPSASKLIDDANAPLGTFSSRTEMCFALGLVDEYEYTEIGLIRKVRNEFAHAKHGITFSSPRVQGLCSSL
ncbi:MAG: transcriptional regulator, partial [Aquabacterium sp.]